MRWILIYAFLSGCSGTHSIPSMQNITKYNCNQQKYYPVIGDSPIKIEHCYKQYRQLKKMYEKQHLDIWRWEFQFNSVKSKKKLD